MQKSSLITASLLGCGCSDRGISSPEYGAAGLGCERTILVSAANILLVYFVLALLIERACEVAMELLTAAGAVAPKDNLGQGGAPSDRRMVSIFICLLFATAISLAGLRLVEMILEVASRSDVQPDGYFAMVDALLTSLILAGGSDGIHQIMQRVIG